MIGSALVALVSFGFAKLADLGLEFNHYWSQRYPLAVWFVLPCGLALLTWFTAKYTPFVGGSGIPQVIASIEVAHGANKSKLLRLGQTLWKIPLTFLAMVIGASVGREGPSVQVGAAVMLAWSELCRRYQWAFRALTTNELIATGAAGGLAAAFNAPLAGVIFAIEELGRGTLLRWERRVLIGVLAAGFILVAIQGNSPYFPKYQGITDIPNICYGYWSAVYYVACSAGCLPGYWPRAWPVPRHYFAALLFAVIRLLWHSFLVYVWLPSVVIVKGKPMVPVIKWWPMR